MVLQTSHAQTIESHPTLPGTPTARFNKIFFKIINERCRCTEWPFPPRIFPENPPDAKVFAFFYEQCKWHLIGISKSLYTEVNKFTAHVYSCQGS